LAPVATPAVAAPVARAAPGTRGAPCSTQEACGAGLQCAPLPGGYCASACGVTGNACDGACVETGRSGEVCLRSCTRDDDCRKDEGYVCDPAWHACAIPNFAAIRANVCPSKSPARDPAFDASEAWSTPASPGVYQLEPSAVLDEGGVIALYATSADTVGSSHGTTFERATHPWLARTGTTLRAAWLAASQISLASSVDHGVTWTPPIAVSDPADCVEGAGKCERPMVVAAASLLYVLYGAGDAAGLRVRASRDGGKTFGAPVTALAGNYGNAIAEGARLHVVTINGNPLGAYGSAEQRIEYAASADGGASFTAPVTVSARDEVLPFFAANPAIAVDSKRKWIYVAYVRGGRDAKWDVVLAVSRDGATWKRTKLAGDDCAIHMVPNLALDPTTGTLHVAYYDSEGAYRLTHASCAAGGTKCKVLGAINSAPFAALSPTRDSSKSLGEHESLVVDDKRRTLHAVWSQTIDEGGKPITRIFHAAAKLKP